MADYQSKYTGGQIDDLLEEVEEKKSTWDEAAAKQETDPSFSGSAAANITQNDINNWNSKTNNQGTITEILMNGASKGSSGVIDLGNVLTAIKNFQYTPTTVKVMYQFGSNDPAYKVIAPVTDDTEETDGHAGVMTVEMYQTLKRVERLLDALLNITDAKLITSPVNGSTIDIGEDTGISTGLGQTGISKSLIVRGINLTEPLVFSVTGSGFSVTPGGITAAQANAGQEITLQFSASGLSSGDHYGTLTISSDEVEVSITLQASKNTGGGGTIQPA